VPKAHMSGKGEQQSAEAGDRLHWRGPVHEGFRWPVAQLAAGPAAMARPDEHGTFLFIQIF
jgi:hypothetical protein